ncbi:hypothetical protein ACHQM5_027704 [Ranunculus cassubicifolius]
MQQGNPRCLCCQKTVSTPQDVCALSLVSKTFQSAAASDVVWEKFLPRDYNEILSRTVPPLNLSSFESKKELYFHLCKDHVLIDGGTKSLKLEKRSGKKCLVIGSRELAISWGETPSYWQWISHPKSRFSEVAHLLHVWWLEINGKIEARMLSPKTRYAVYLVLTYNDAFGLDYPASEANIQFVDGERNASGVRAVYLDDSRRFQQDYNIPEVTETPDESKLPREREDGWLEVEMGEFYNDHGDYGEAKMTLKEVTGYSKGGLIVEGIELRPKANST